MRTVAKLETNKLQQHLIDFVDFPPGGALDSYLVTAATNPMFKIEKEILNFN